MSLETIGRLDLPGGEVVAADPYVMTKEPRPLRQRLAAETVDVVPARRPRMRCRAPRRDRRRRAQPLGWSDRTPHAHAGGRSQRRCPLSGASQAGSIVGRGLQVLGRPSRADCVLVEVARVDATKRGPLVLDDPLRQRREHTRLRWGVSTMPFSRCHLQAQADIRHDAVGLTHAEAKPLRKLCELQLVASSLPQLNSPTYPTSEVDPVALRRPLVVGHDAGRHRVPGVIEAEVIPLDRPRRRCRSSVSTPRPRAPGAAPTTRSSSSAHPQPTSSTVTGDAAANLRARASALASESGALKVRWR